MKRILVCEDEDVIREFVVINLKRVGYDVYDVSCGEDALRAFEAAGGNFDIVLLDIMMPGMDGVEALHAIRGLEGDYYKELPIVALTANAVTGAREMFLSEGFQDFVMKPIEMNAMERCLRQWLPQEMICKEQEEGEKRS